MTAASKNKRSLQIGSSRYEMTAKQLAAGTVVGAATLSATGYVMFGIVLRNFYAHALSAGSASGVPRDALLFWAVGLGALSVRRAHDPCDRESRRVADAGGRDQDRGGRRLPRLVHRGFHVVRNKQRFEPDERTHRPNARGRAECTYRRRHRRRTPEAAVVLSRKAGTEETQVMQHSLCALEVSDASLESISRLSSVESPSQNLSRRSRHCMTQALNSVAKRAPRCAVRRRVRERFCPPFFP